MPVIYGGFTGVDMKSGAPAFGTPGVKCVAGSQPAALWDPAGLQRQRRQRPRRPSGGEPAAALVGGRGHTNFVKYAAGWMEGGLTASFEKFMMEMLQAMSEILRPISVADADLGIEAIKDGQAGTSSAPTRWSGYGGVHSPSCRTGGTSRAGPRRCPDGVGAGAHPYKKVLADFTTRWTGSASELAAFVAMRKEDQIEI